MQTFKKNQIIITALVIMIAIAGYLQFTEKDIDDTQQVMSQDEGFNEENVKTPTALVPNDNKTDVAVKEDTNTADDAKQEETSNDGENVASDAKEDANETPAKETAADNNTDNSVGEAVFVSTNNVEASHFLDAKIDREQTYSSLKQDYLAIINNNNLKDEQKVDAVKEFLDLEERIEKEATAESLLEAKGFKDVFVRMNGGDVDVVINAEELSQAELAQIHDIVSRKTLVDPEKIHITLLDVSKK